jgi:hypothetical protein
MAEAEAVMRLAGIAAVGAGLHVAALRLEHPDDSIGSLGAALAIVLPVAVYIVVVYAVCSLLLRSIDRFDAVLLAITAAVLGFAVVLVLVGAGFTAALAVTLRPARHRDRPRGLRPGRARRARLTARTIVRPWDQPDSTLPALARAASPSPSSSRPAPSPSRRPYSDRRRPPKQGSAATAC